LRKVTKTRMAISFDNEVFQNLEEYKEKREMDRSEVVNMAVKHFMEITQSPSTDQVKSAIATLIENSVLKVLQSKEFEQLLSNQLKKDLNLK